MPELFRRLSPPTLAAALLTAWATFSAWCVHAFPPAVDLPAHAAQMQTLADIVQGGPAASYYTWQFPIGYGLTTWLGLPLALLFNGAVAARFLLWLTLLLFPLAHAALARALGRSGWVAVVAAPCIFSLSYWFGFLPTLFALPWVLFAWAGFARRIATGAWRFHDVLLQATVATVVMLCHLVPFGALAVGVLAMAIASRRKLHMLAACAVLATPLALSLIETLTLAARAVTPGEHLPSQYGLVAHFNWTLHRYDNAQRFVAWVGVSTALTFVVAWFRRRTEESPLAPALSGAMLALYIATPLSVSGAWLIHARLPVFIVVTALLLTDFARISRAARVALTLSAAASLVAVAQVHVAFSRQIAGLETVIAAPPPPGLHGGLMLGGLALPGQRIKYLEHLPQWWTATHGGVGNHFFADADHQPVVFAPGISLTQLLVASRPEELRDFRALLVFGSGPLPRALDGFSEVSSAGLWRRVEARGD